MNRAIEKQAIRTKITQKLRSSSAAVVIGALRGKVYIYIPHIYMRFL